MTAQARAYGLRPAEDGDFEALFDVLKQAFTPLGPLIGPWEDAAQRAAFRRSFSPGQDQAVIANGALAGLFGLRRHIRGLFLMHLALVPDVQGRGIGKDLVARVTAESRRIRLPAELTVHRANPAKGLYERAGFQPIMETDTKTRMRYSMTFS